MSFADLKKQSKLGSLTAKLVKEVEKMNNSGGSGDDRLWKLDVDKSGNGYAVIRFLPAPDGEDLPFVKLYSHAFQGPGGWYIENSLTTLGQKDPVSEENTILWNTGVDSDKEIARKRKRKLSYYSNIYVVSDPKHPENEGKVFLFKFGKKIFDKITEAMNPAFEDEKPINPFDFWSGANFKLKIRKVDGFWNYDKSEFEAPTPVADNDDTIKDIWGKQYPLKPFLETSNFKSYDDLREKFNRVIAGSKNTETASEIDLPPTTSSPAPVKQAAVGQVNEASKSVDDDDDTLSYFSKLAEDE